MLHVKNWKNWKNLEQVPKNLKIYNSTIFTESVAKGKCTVPALWYKRFLYFVQCENTILSFSFHCFQQAGVLYYEHYSYVPIPLSFLYSIHPLFSFTTSHHHHSLPHPSLTVPVIQAEASVTEAEFSLPVGSREAGRHPSAVMPAPVRLGVHFQT